jgi:RimJ/RimL family protein N-acetyltransferase
MIAEAACIITIESGFPRGASEDLWKWLHTPDRSANFDDFGTSNWNAFDYELEQRIKTEATWAIRIGERVIGYIGFAQANPVFGQLHGVVLDPEFRGQGLGPTALRDVIGGLVRKGVWTVIAYIYEDNPQAMRMLVKCGFYCAGTIPHGGERNGNPLELLLMVWNKELQVG